MFTDGNLNPKRKIIFEGEFLSLQKSGIIRVVFFSFLPLSLTLYTLFVKLIKLPSSLVMTFHTQNQSII